MQKMSEWQHNVLNDLSAKLGRNPNFLGLVLYGSFADDKSGVDEWSDIDLMAIVSDEKIGAYFLDQEWLSKYGTLLGLDRQDESDRKILRLVYAPCNRVDITLVSESVLNDYIRRDAKVISKVYKVLWSKVPEINRGLPELLRAPVFKGHSDNSIEALIEAFWFKASASIAKTARGDLLVGMHLALDLARDCLVLQMIQRDEIKGTNVHRFGGFGNEIVDRVLPATSSISQRQVLGLIRHSILLFDELARKMSSGYVPRSELLIPAIQHLENNF